MNKISLMVIAIVMLVMCSGCRDDNLNTKSLGVGNEIVTDEETGVVYKIEEDANKPGSGHYTARILYDPATDTNSQAGSTDK